jgi:hypothetical protein
MNMVVDVSQKRREEDGISGRVHLQRKHRGLKIGLAHAGLGHAHAGRGEDHEPR